MVLYTVNGTANWLCNVFRGLLLLTDEKQLLAPQCHIVTALLLHLTFSAL